MQIKTLEKAQKLASALNTIEEECGIKNVNIEFKNMFLCEWIDLEELNKTEMECLIRDMLKGDCEADEKAVARVQDSVLQSTNN